MLKRMVSILAVALMIFGLSGIARAEDGPRHIAVFPIKMAAGINHFWEGDFDPGAAMTSLISDALVKSNRYTVFDRQQLDKMAADLGVVGPMTPETAVQVGERAGVQYIVTGTVVQFVTIGKPPGKGFSIPRTPLIVGGGAQRVRVAVEIRITDVSTGHIIASLRGEGEDVVNDLVFGGYKADPGLEGLFESTEFLTSGLGRAMTQASEAVLGQMDLSKGP